MYKIIIERKIEYIKELIDTMDFAESDILEFEFKKIGIKEVDYIIDKMERNIKNADISFYDVENISQGLGMSMGFLTVNYESQNVFCTKGVLDIFEIEHDLSDSYIQKVPISKFDNFKDMIFFSTLKDEKNLYYIRNGTKKKWIKYIKKDPKFSNRGFMIDVTEIIINKYGEIFNEEYDYLTGLYTNDIFIKNTDEYVKNHTFKTLCLITLEVSNYMDIENIYGKKDAQKCLVKFSEALKFDASEAFAGRNENEKFLILMFNNGTKQELMEKFCAWQHKIEKGSSFVTEDGRKHYIKFCAGYSFYPDDAETTDLLFKYSAYALYENKRIYKEPFRAFYLESYNRDMYLESMEKELKDILNKNDIYYCFQPIVNLTDGSVYGYEALMRPNSNIFLNPMDIIDYSVSEDKEYFVERITIFNCLKILKENYELFKEKRFFFNSFGVQVLNSEDLKNIQNEYEEIIHLMIFELSENMPEYEVQNKFKFLREHGCKIAVDKYGIGFADEKKLFSLNPQYIKLDISLISNISLKKESQAYVSKIVKYAKEHNVMVVAVGVETRDELYTVMKLGVDFAQGYYLALPKKEFVKEIKREIRNEILEMHML